MGWEIGGGGEVEIVIFITSPIIHDDGILIHLPSKICIIRLSWFKSSIWENRLVRIPIFRKVTKTFPKVIFVVVDVVDILA